MAAFRYTLLSGLGLLSTSLWAQQSPTQISATLAPPTSSTSEGIVYRQDSVLGYQPPTYKAGPTQLVQDVQCQIRYPAAALRAQASGRVLVRLLVEANGTLSETSIVQSPSPLLNDEVLRAVKTLTGFAPARSYGQPVRGSLLCPVTFRITASSVPTGSARPLVALRPLPRGPVQPHAAPAAGNAVLEKVTSYRDSLYWTENDSYWTEKDRSRRPSVYQHYFTYDGQGRPATHTQESWARGKLLHFTQWRYDYGKDDRLRTKVSKWAKTTFAYTEAGQLSCITSWRLWQQQWVRTEETLLREQARLPSGNRLVRLVTNNQHGAALGSGAPLETYCTIDYTVAPDESIIASTVLRYSYKSFTDLPVPSGYTFTQDEHANPLRDLQMQMDYYQFEWERSSPHNLVLERERDEPFKSTAWRYNAAGHPVYGVVSNAVGMPYRDYTFTYANIVVPASARAPRVATDSVSGVSLYPNPATATTVVKAPSIGPGEATLRLFTANGQLQRQTSFRVAQTFEQTISVVGLAKGVYVVQISNGTRVATGRLEVD